MGKLAHELEYLASTSIEKIARSLSLRQADRFGAFLGKLSYHLISSRRKIALKNLKLSLNNKYSDSEYDEICKSVFDGFAKTFVEMSRFGIINKNNVGAIIYGDEKKLVEQSVAHGKGTIVVSAHYGNFEMIGLWLRSIGYEISLLIPEHHNKKFDKKLISIRKTTEIGVFQIPRQIKHVFKFLKGNNILALCADQHAPAGNLVMDFLGRPASMLKGPALFSIRTGAPILPLLLKRESYDRHVLISAPLIFPPNSGDEEEDIRSIVATYNKFFEDEIYKNPDQWLWTHRRWKV